MAADTVFVKGEGGNVIEMALPLHDTIADKLRTGHVQRCDADGILIPPEDSDDLVPGLPNVRPALNAVKAEWVGWAVHNGADPEAAEAMTKNDLVDQYGSDVPPGAPAE